MSTYKTPNLGLHDWGGNDAVQRQEFAENFLKIDAAVGDYIEEVDTSSKDTVVGVYTTVNYKRLDGTKYAKAVLSNKPNGYYLTDTWTYYAADGTTVVKTVTWTLTYDADGIVTNKTYVIS